MSNPISAVQTSYTANNLATYNPPPMPNTATQAASKVNNQTQTIMEVQDSSKSKNPTDNTESYIEKDIYYEYKNGTLTVFTVTERNLNVSV